MTFLHLPEPYRAQGQQINADGNDKAHCDLFCKEQMQEHAEVAVDAERVRLAAQVGQAAYDAAIQAKNGEAVNLQRVILNAIWGDNVPPRIMLLFLEQSLQAKIARIDTPENHPF